MMWTGRELKERAKEALHRNYWKIVLVSSLTLLLGGSMGSVGVGGGKSEEASQATEVEESEIEDQSEVQDQVEVEVQSGGQYQTAEESPMQAWVRQRVGEWDIPPAIMGVAVVVSAVIFLMIAVVIFLVVLAADIFLRNPFSVGVGRFMLKSVDDRAEAKEIVYGFDHSYKNIVRTLFHRDIQILLWTLLLIVPGIYKKYQYRLVAYIMAEHPDMDYRNALQMSRDMMNGHKWKAFVLDLTFVLWHFLGTITCGIVEALYVQPYHQLTWAALYRRLSGPVWEDSVER